jgi:type III pantothenate kinase
MSLIYYFDMGNTRAKFWRCHNGQLQAQVYIPHNNNISHNNAGHNAGHLLMQLPAEFQAIPVAILGSSVLEESALADFSKACEQKWGLPAVFARSSARHAGVLNAYVHNPERLGVDRWLALIAVRERQQNVCVVDCGTAVTIDVLQKDGQHLGGYILPGLTMMADVLLQQTKRVRFDAASVEAGVSLGTSTGEAVQHGALAAVIALIERLVAQYGVHLVLTGGDAPQVAAGLSIPYGHEPELLLHGLQCYFQNVDISTSHTPSGA